jgi:hypothetical protein
MTICTLLLAAKHSESFSNSALRDIVLHAWRSQQHMDTLLLVATHMHAQVYKKLAAFIKETLNFSRLPINVDNLQSIAKLFTEELIPIDLLATSILTISPHMVQNLFLFY